MTTVFPPPAFKPLMAHFGVIALASARVGQRGALIWVGARPDATGCRAKTQIVEHEEGQ